MTEFRVNIDIAIGASLAQSVNVDNRTTAAHLPRVGETINLRNYSVEVVEVFHFHWDEEVQLITLVVTTGDAGKDDALIRHLQETLT